jgi:hypothetical protein
MGRGEVHRGLGVRTFKGRFHLEEQGRNRRLILKWNVRWWGGKTFWIGLTQNTAGGGKL